MAVIYLVRHGQASFGKRNYDALSPVGEEQSRVLGAALAERVGHPDRVIVGGMQRHRQTAVLTLEAMGVAPEWDEDPCWSEYDHQEIIERYNPLYKSGAELMAGLLKGMNARRAFQEVFEKALARWTGGKHDAEYGESWPAFKQRVQRGLRSIQEADAQTTFVFTSGGAISASVRQLWNLPDSQWTSLNRIIANATLTKVIIGKSGLHLSTFNEHGHFEGRLYGHLLTYR